MNNDNGRIWFSVGIDNEGLKRDAEKSKQIISDMVNGIEDLGKKIDKSLKLNSASDNEKYLAELKNELNELQTEMSKAGKVTGEMVAKEGDLKAEIAAVTKELSLEREQLASVAGSVDNLKAKLAGLSAEFNKLSPADAFGAEGQSLQNEMKETAAEIDRLKGKLPELTKEQQLQKAITESEAGSIDQLKLKIASLSNSYKKLSEDKRTGPEGTKMKEELDQLAISLNKATGKTEQLTKEQKLQQSINNSQYGSLEQLRLKLESLALAYSKLSKYDREGFHGKQMKAEMEQLGIAYDKALGRAQKLDKELELEKKLYASASGSVNQMRIALQLLVAQYEKLSAAQRKGPEGKALGIEIGKLEEDLSIAQKEMKKTGDAGDGMGKKISSSASKAFGFLRTLANIIPGLGIAGLIGLISEAVIALIVDLVKGNGALDKFKRSVEITNEALKSNEYTEAKAKVQQLRNELELAKDGLLDKKKVLGEYNDSLGKATGGVKSLGEMEQKLNQSAEAYLQMLQLKTKATIAYRKAAEEGIEADVELNNYGDYGSAMSRFFKSPAKWFKVGAPNRGANPFQVQIDFVDNKRKSEKNLNELGDTFQKQAAEIAKKYKLNFFNDTDTKGGKSIAQQVYDDTKKLRELLDEIKGSNLKYDIQFGSNADSEEQKINKYFDSLKKKVDEWNKDPSHKKTGVLLTDAAIKRELDDIEASRKYALGLADDKEAGDNLLKQLEEQKKRYQEYEDFKRQYGEEAANQLYGNLTTKYKTYLQRVQAEYDKLDKKGKAGLNPAESNLFSKLTTVLTGAKTDSETSDTKWLAKALGDYSSYESKKKAIVNRYQEERKKAVASGSADILAGVNKSEQDELKSLKANNSAKLANMEQFASGAVFLTKKAVTQQIEILQNLLKTSDLTEDVKAEIQKKIDQLGKVIRQPENSFVSSQVDVNIAKTEAALATLAKSGDTSSEAFKKLNEELLKLKREKAEVSITNIEKSLEFLSDLAPALTELSGALNESGNNAAAQIGGVFASLAGGAKNISDALKKFEDDGVDSIDAIGTAAQFVISIISNIVSSTQAQKKAYEDYYLQNISYQNDYNNALIDEIRLRQGIKDSVFFNDYAGKINSGLAAEIESVKKYNEALAKLQDSQVITGTKKVRDWGAVAATTVTGAAGGAAVGGPWGAAIGAAVGFIGGMLKKRQVVNVFDGLLKTYPKLIDEQGNLNKAMASAIISSGKIEGSSKENLQYLISMNEQYEKAKEQIEGVISDLAGSLGNDLMSSLFDDWAKGGGDVGKAFADGVSKSLANIGKNLLFNAVFGDDFVALQDKIKEGFRTTGDPASMITALLDFNKEAIDKGAQYQKLLDEYAKQLKEQGIEDVFGLINEEAKRQGSSKGLASMSQDSANELNGRFTTIQGHTYQMNESLKLMTPLTQYSAEIKAGILFLQDRSAKALIHLANIDTNTARLEGIERDIRSVKTGIDDINLKGIKLKT